MLSYFRLLINIWSITFIGILTKEGNVDIDRMKIIRKITTGMKLTFHRAYDVCNDPIKVVFLNSILSF